MRRIENAEKLAMRGVVTYEFRDGRRVDFDARAVSEYGIEALMRAAGLADMIPSGRVDVWQHGRKVGSVPSTFDPMAIKSTNFFYDVRHGDFIRKDDHWIANRTLGPGDLEAVPGFVWDRGNWGGRGGHGFEDPDHAGLGARDHQPLQRPRHDG